MVMRHKETKTDGAAGAGTEGGAREADRPGDPLCDDQHVDHPIFTGQEALAADPPRQRVVMPCC
jgi:hypothetical protein